MADKLYTVTIFLFFLINFCVPTKIYNIGERRIVNNMENLAGNIKKNFIFYKSKTFIERSCNCIDEISCSCCESVMMLSIQTSKRLCANFIYQRNGLNIDIALDAKILRNITVTTYRPFTICTIIPKSLSSFACLNILEVNKFPRSITVCPRLNVKTKAQDWKLYYRCISISTSIPTVNSQTTDSQLNTASSMSSSMIPKNEVSVVMPSVATFISFDQAKLMSTMRLTPHRQTRLNPSVETPDEIIIN